MSRAKQIAPGTATYTHEGRTYTLYRTWDNYYDRWKPWYVSLGVSFGGGTADELTDLVELATHLAEVCRELELTSAKS
jgi:hypothetical protein